VTGPRLFLYDCPPSLYSEVFLPIIVLTSLSSGLMRHELGLYSPFFLGNLFFPTNGMISLE